MSRRRRTSGQSAGRAGLRPQAASGQAGRVPGPRAVLASLRKWGAVDGVPHWPRPVFRCRVGGGMVPAAALLPGFPKA